MQILSKTKSFINKHDWNRLNYPSRKDDWKKFEKNNPKKMLLMCSVLMKLNVKTKTQLKSLKINYYFNNLFIHFHDKGGIIL